MLKARGLLPTFKGKRTTNKLKMEAYKNGVIMINNI